MIRLALPLLLLAAPPALGQTKHPAKTKSTKPTRQTAAPAASAEPAAAETATLGLDTPIGKLIADPRAKAVLDKDLPGLSDDENLSKFEDKSLRQFQPLTGGQLTDAMLEQTGKDLAAATSEPLEATLTPTPAASTIPDAASPADPAVEQKSEAPVVNSADDDKPR